MASFRALPGGAQIALTDNDISLHMNGLIFDAETEAQVYSEGE
jgi:hypothetical protein